jgi:hypothetical protein
MSVTCAEGNACDRIGVVGVSHGGFASGPRQLDLPDCAVCDQPLGVRPPTPGNAKKFACQTAHTAEPPRMGLIAAMGNPFVSGGHLNHLGLVVPGSAIIHSFAVVHSNRCCPLYYVGLDASGYYLPMLPPTAVPVPRPKYIGVNKGYT